MMPIRSDDELRKVTLNLYEADCVWLEREYGRGWTERVRQHIHNEVTERSAGKNQKHFVRTLGDVFDGK